LWNNQPTAILPKTETSQCTLMKNRTHILTRLLRLVLVSLCLLSCPDPGQAQDTPAADPFVDLGTISFSKEYKIKPGDEFIIFPIRNNSSRTISNIHAWIYKYSEDANGQPSGLLLVNNPHRGGMVADGKTHTPGTVADWRFPLVRGNRTSDPTGKFTLRVSPKSILFALIEPAQKKTEP